MSGPHGHGELERVSDKAGPASLQAPASLTRFGAHMAQNRKTKQRVANVAGDLPDSATADSTNQATDSFANALRYTIESQPYTAVIVAFGLGWLWGRMHRPF
jgi:hypothetical protein